MLAMDYSKKGVLILFTFFMVSGGFCQAQTADNWQQMPESMFLGRVDNLPSNVRGTYKLFSENREGYFVYIDGKRSDAYFVNFDLYNRSVIVSKEESGFEYSLNQNEIKSITVSNGSSDSSFYIKLGAKAFDDIDSDTDFFYKSMSPSHSYIRTDYCELLPPEKGAYASGRDYYEFKIYPEYYLKNSDGLYEKLNFSKSKLKKILGKEKAENLLDEMKRLGLNLKDPESLTKALTALSYE